MESMMKASYELSLFFVSKKKSCSDREKIIKNILIFFQNVGDINIKNMVNKIALSRNTIMYCINDMGQDVGTQIVSVLQYWTTVLQIFVINFG